METEKGKNAFSGDFRFGRELQKIANRFRRLADENLGKEGITVSQLRVLAYVSRKREEGKVYQKDLEQHFGIRRSSVTELLQNMEKSGILKRTPCPKDARIREISLTEKGLILDERLKEYITNLEEELLLGFSSEEKDILRSLLFRLGENMEMAERNRV